MADKKKILIVDDEKDLVETVGFRLKHAGYDVTCAYDGAEALLKVKDERPDLIILDVMLPKLDGYKVCSLLKKDALYSDIPIVMFTARVQEEDIRLGKEMGIDAYIIKPFDSKELLDKIRELLKIS